MRPPRIRPPSNQCRINGVTSGTRRCRVQTTVALRAHSVGRSLTVCRMSDSLTLPKTPHTSTRSAGTAPRYADVVAASPWTTRTCWSACLSALVRATSTFAESSSTRRAATSWPRACVPSTGSRSRPWPAHMLMARSCRRGAASRNAAMCRWTISSRCASLDSGWSYASCHATQSVGRAVGAITTPWVTAAGAAVNARRGRAAAR